jgi:hypothetical protein
MNETTMALSQLIGPLFLLLGISLLVRKSAYLKLFKKIEQEGIFLLLASMIEFIAGLAIVLHHNLWTTPAEFIISIIGWGMVAEGTLMMLNSKFYIKKVVRMLSPTLLSVGAVISIVIGGYLCSLVYFV